MVMQMTYLLITVDMCVTFPFLPFLIILFSTAPTVILDLEKLPPCPSRTQCPECRQFIMTETFSTVSSVTWMVCFMTALIGYESISWSRSKELIGSSWAASPFLWFHIYLQGSCFFFSQLSSRLLLYSLLPRQVQNYHAQVPKVPNVTPNHQKALRGKVSLFYLRSKWRATTRETSSALSFPFLINFSFIIWKNTHITVIRTDSCLLIFSVVNCLNCFYDGRK